MIRGALAMPDDVLCVNCKLRLRESAVVHPEGTEVEF